MIRKSKIWIISEFYFPIVTSTGYYITEIAEFIAKNKKVDGFKVHSSDLINKNLLDKLSRIKKKDIFLSSGGSTLREISYAVNIFKKNKIKPVLMHGYQSYPTKIKDTNLNRINLLKNILHPIALNQTQVVTLSTWNMMRNLIME